MIMVLFLMRFHDFREQTVLGVKMYGVGNSFFMHLDNNKRYPKQRLANTTITSEAKYPINFI